MSFMDASSNIDLQYCYNFTIIFIVLDFSLTYCPHSLSVLNLFMLHSEIQNHLSISLVEGDFNTFINIIYNGFSN